ncbi:protein FAM186A [Acomys russatus]|uniref:protein FAM186A n=1 Tax=Acomys russatus TaxID=60746 RepID=UPI0021E23B87|nr:protein FAM186A [Acomys russatus]
MFAKRQNDINSDSNSETDLKETATTKRNPEDRHDTSASSKLEVPLSVQAVITKIEKAKLLRAREDVLTQLIEILSNVELIMTRYSIDSSSPGQKGLFKQNQKKKRRVLLEKISAYIKNIDIREKILLRLQSWLEEWNFLLSEVMPINMEEYYHWVAKMEMMPETLKEMDYDVNILLRMVTSLLEEKKRQKKKTTSRGTLWKAWKDRVTKRPATAHALRPDQMISDPYALNTKVSEIQEMLHELISTGMLNKLENSAVKYISSMVLNLSRALSTVNEELKLVSLHVSSTIVCEEEMGEKDVSQKIIQELTEENEMIQQRLREAEERCDQLTRVKNYLGHQVLLPTPSFRTLTEEVSQASIDKKAYAEEIDSLLNKELEKMIDDSQKKGARGTAVKWDSSMTFVAQGEGAPDATKKAEATESQRKFKGLPIGRPTGRPTGPPAAETQDTNLEEEEERRAAEIKSSQLAVLQALEKRKKDWKAKGPAVKGGPSAMWDRVKKGKAEHSLTRGPATEDVKQSSTARTDKEGKAEAELPKTAQPESAPELRKMDTRWKKLLSGKPEEAKQLGKLQPKTLKQALASLEESEQTNLESFHRAILAFLRERANNVGKAFDPSSTQKEEGSLRRAEVEKLDAIKTNVEDYFQKVAEAVTKTVRTYKDAKREQLREKFSKQQKVTPAMPQLFHRDTVATSKTDVSKLLISEITDPAIRKLVQVLLDELEGDRDPRAHRRELQKQEEEMWKEEQRRQRQRGRERAQQLEQPDLPGRDGEEGERQDSKLKQLEKPKPSDLARMFNQSVMLLNPRWAKTLKPQTTQAQAFQVDSDQTERLSDEKMYASSLGALLVSQKPLPMPVPAPAQMAEPEMSHVATTPFTPKQTKTLRGPLTQEHTIETESPFTAEREQGLGTQPVITRTLKQKETPKGSLMSEKPQDMQMPLTSMELQLPEVTLTQSTALPHQQVQVKDVTLTSQQALELGITPAPEKEKGPGVSLTHQQAQALGITLTPEQTEAQRVSLTPQQAHALGLTLTPEQTEAQRVSLTPQQAQALGFTLTTDQAQALGVTLTPEQTEAQRVSLTPQQAQALGLTLTPQQGQALGIAPTPQPEALKIPLTPQQAQALGMAPTPQPETLKIPLTPQQAQALGMAPTPQPETLKIPLTPQQAQALGMAPTPQPKAFKITLTPEQAQAQEISLNPQQAKALGLTPTPQQAYIEKIYLTPQQAQALGITLTPEQAKTPNITVTPQQAWALGLTLTSEQAKAQKISLTFQQAEALGLTLTSQQAQALGMAPTPQPEAFKITLTPEQAQAQEISLNPQQAQALGLTPTPQQAYIEKIYLTPQQAQALGITLTPEQAKTPNITITPQQAWALGLTLTLEQAKAQKISLTPQQAEALGLTLTPEQAQALGVKLPPEQAKAPRIPLSPEQAQALGVKLPPAQAKAPRITLSPEQAQALGVKLSPEQAKAPRITLSPEQAQALGVKLPPEQTEAPRIPLSPEQAQALGVKLPPEQTEAPRIPLSPEQAQALGVKLPPQQTKAPRIPLSPEQAQALGIALTPEQAEAPRITVRSEQAQALGVKLPPEPTEAPRIPLSPEQAQALGIALTPEQAEALGISPSLPQRQAQGVLLPQKFRGLDVPLTPEQAEAGRSPFTMEQLQTPKIPIIPESTETPKPAIPSKQTQATEIPLPAQQSLAFGVPFAQRQGLALEITPTPGQTQAFEQVQALQAPLTWGQAPSLHDQFAPRHTRTLTFTIALEKAQELGVTFTYEQIQAAAVTFTSEQVAALEEALTAELAWKWGVLIAPEKAPEASDIMAPNQLQGLGAAVPFTDRLPQKWMEFPPTSIPLEKLPPSPTLAPLTPWTGPGLRTLPDSEKLEEPGVSPIYRQILAGRGQVMPAQPLAPEVPPLLRQLPTPGAPPTLGPSLGPGHIFRPGDTWPPLPSETIFRPKPPPVSAVPPILEESPELLVPGGSTIPRFLPFQPPAAFEHAPYSGLGITYSAQQIPPWTSPEQPFPFVISPTSPHPSPAEASPIPGRPQRISPFQVTQKPSGAVSSPKPELASAHPSAALGFEVSQAPFPTEKIQIPKASDTTGQTRVLQDSFDMKPFGKFQPYVTSSRIPGPQSPHVDERSLSRQEKALTSLPSLTTQPSQMHLILPSQRGPEPRLPAIDKPWIPTPDARKAKATGTPLTDQHLEDRYYINVEAQRKNLAILNQAAQMSGLPSQYHTMARGLIVDLLHTNTVRLGYLSRKYVAYRLIQLARNNLTKRLKAIQNTGKGYETQSLYLMLNRLDDYQKKVMCVWTEKQKGLEERRKRCLWSMMHFFSQGVVGISVKLNLSQPTPMVSGFKQTRDITKFQRPGLKLLVEEDQKPACSKHSGSHCVALADLHLTEYRQGQTEAVWNAELSTSSYPITEKTPMSALWAQLGGYPDIPKLLQLDIQATFRKSLASLRSQ